MDGVYAKGILSPFSNLHFVHIYPCLCQSAAQFLTARPGRQPAGAAGQPGLGRRRRRCCWPLSPGIEERKQNRHSSKFL